MFIKQIWYFIVSFKYFLLHHLIIKRSIWFKVNICSDRKIICYYHTGMVGSTVEEYFSKYEERLSYKIVWYFFTYFEIGKLYRSFHNCTLKYNYQKQTVKQIENLLSSEIPQILKFWNNVTIIFSKIRRLCII